MIELINKIHLANSEKFLSKINDNSIKLIITSPPYWDAVKYENTNKYNSGSYEIYLKSLEKIWIECERILEPNGKLAINSPIMPIPQQIINQDTRHIKNINNDIEKSLLKNTKLNLFSLYIWQKQTSKLMFGSYPYPGNLLENNTIEFINIFVKPGKSKKYDKITKEKNLLSKDEWIDLTQQVWFMVPDDIARKKGHPAPFPEKLPARLIKMFSHSASETYDGDIVLDPFCGLGTTCIAAKKLDRRFIGVDIVKKYTDLAKAKVHNTKKIPSIYLIGKSKFKSKKELLEIQSNLNLNSIQNNKNSKQKLNTNKDIKKNRSKKYGRGVISNEVEDAQYDMILEEKD